MVGLWHSLCLLVYTGVLNYALVSEDIFDSTAGGLPVCLCTALCPVYVCVTSICFVEARGAVEHPALPRSAPTTRNYLVPNDSNTKVEKPWYIPFL